MRGELSLDGEILKNRCEEKRGGAGVPRQTKRANVFSFLSFLLCGVSNKS